jgi:hypothetical protein
MQKLQEHSWQVKMSKCEFAQTSISYLGHIISDDGVSADQSKIATMRDWTSPISFKELKSFLGLLGYYKKFVKNYGVIAKPLTNLDRGFVCLDW